ncbi:putative beta-1,4-xylosyltransferase IRX9 [Marchantia polymorpha subsp. ruderalis]|uniref:Glycosyltransferases n=2 Tax=Marchantia polymorpha TaxID=3197 RepID=A0AAF6AKS4_MARPO|nr:hypothetical protein MARPO_0113s0008 [Marchantia polymorpha]BBM97044.1 hypothetical protein Mp_1g02600 [Marchantia polymorpha subsp. ruderalis]|eukprot:PTQ31266.1 hypothetical protein MARPO_0113s0008 [Marchantia polymorpha]
MARALRRTLSPHIHHEHSGCSSSSSIGGRATMNSAFVMQNGIADGGGGGGGGAVCGAAPSAGRLLHTPPQQQQQQMSSHISSLTSLASGGGGGGGLGGVLGSSSPGGSLARASSISDGFYNLSKLSFLSGLSWFKLLSRAGSMDRPMKSKGTLYRRPMMQLLLSFVLGLVLGFTPISWSGLAAERDDPRRELALEVNGFVTNLPREGSQSGHKLIELESGQGAVGLAQEGFGGLNLDVDASDSLVASRLAFLEESSLEIAPGLNFTRDSQRNLIIVVTPTYNRAFQAHFLVRLAHTLRLVPPPLLWLVVESPSQSIETATLLRQTGIMYRHLVCNDNMTSFKDRGIFQRNAALKHIETHQLDGVVYFADDDNIYSLELFEQLRKIKRFGTWPVGMLAESKAKTIVEGPVCDEGKVIGWHTNEKSKRLRRFHVDMSGFGFNSTMLWDKSAWRHRSEEPIRQLDTIKEGMQETTFIEQLVEDESQMEGLPSGCNKIMVWHLHLESTSLSYPSGWSLSTPLDSNLPLRH